MGKGAADKGPVTKQSLTAGTDTDGVPYGDFERESARKWKIRKTSQALQEVARAQQKGTKGKKLSDKEIKKQADKEAKEAVDKLSAEDQAAYIRDWKGAVIDRMNKVGYKGEAAILQGKAPGSTPWVDQTPGAGADQLKKIYDGKDYNNYRYPLLKAIGGDLISDTAWQPETSASFINEKGEKTYPNPNTEYYWVSDGKGYPPGTFAKITAPNGKSVFARALDTNPSRGVSPAGAGGARQLEASPALWNALGYSASGNSAPEGKFDIQVFPGSNGGVARDQLGHLTNEETQEAGKLIEDKDVKSISNREDLERAKKAKEEKDKPSQPEPPKNQKTGLLLMKGFPTVLHGPDLKEVGYACEECVHSGGGFVKEGSDTVYVGKYPLSRIADATSDDLAVVSGGPDTLVGGGTTSSKLG